MGQIRTITLVLFGLTAACSDDDDGQQSDSSSTSGSSSGGASSTSSSVGTSGAETSGTTSSSTATSSGSVDGTSSTSNTSVGTGPQEPLPGGLVVDVAWLQEYAGDERLQLVDARADPGSAHIPGAIHLEPLQIASTVDGIDAQVMPPAGAAVVLSAAGLRNGTTAVVYGVPPEYDPARVTWALSYYGHGDVRYLDGGWAAWQSAGGEIEMGAIDATPSDYEIMGPVERLRVTADAVLKQLGPAPYDAPAIGLVDARSIGEWDAGRIPSATHVEWTRTLAGDGTLLPVAELQRLYADVSPTDIVVSYCLVGWRASVAWLTLTHVGFADVRVYDGSWVEWGNGAFPVDP